jgi:hypothetical protein
MSNQSLAPAQSYAQTKFYQVYDDAQLPDTVVLEWMPVFLPAEQMQAAVLTVLDTVRQNGKTKLRALINAQTFYPKGVQWLIDEWYVPTYQADLRKIAHFLMGPAAFAQFAALQVSRKDTSGIEFFNTDQADKAYQWFGELS